MTPYSPDSNLETLRLALPKGRMSDGVNKLLREAGIQVSTPHRIYRPKISEAYIEAKILKPQNIILMLQNGSRDIGFAGADWVKELEAEVIELCDTELDPVSLVLAAPAATLVDGGLPQGRLRIASEFERLTRSWIQERKLDARFVRSYGATEVFPPEDADCIVDISATGETLHANSLVVVETLLQSSTRLYASPQALSDPRRRKMIDDFLVLIQSVLDARKRVMLEVNVESKDFESVISVLPSLREPTISPLHGEIGYAVKAAVPRKALPTLIPEIRARGGTGIVVFQISQLVA